MTFFYDKFSYEDVINVKIANKYLITLFIFAAAVITEYHEKKRNLIMIIVSKKQIKKFLPKRSKFSNKSDFGKCLIIGGSSSMPGAAILCARAAARSGAGYTYLMSGPYYSKFVQNPDFILLKRQECLKQINKFNSIALGPGILSETEVKKFLIFLIKRNISNVVVDAGALSILNKLVKKNKLPPSWILTPHEGEMSKLINKNANWIRKNREKAVQLAFQKYGCCILLKGHLSLIYNGEKLYCVNQGTPALAKAGTGDVLSGIIAAMLSQKLSSVHAVIIAAYVHGFASQLWKKNKHDEISLMASDLIEILPLSFFKIRKS
jgi:ADP-dependent NAD(P)H-hydrate dehydratase